MRFTTIVTLSFITAAFGAPFAKRQEQLNGNVLFCTERDFAGVCARTPPTDGGCKGLNDIFNRNISSFQIEPEGAFVCVLWSDANCQGSNPGGWIRASIADLSVINFENTASSYQCKSA
ncbi:unnamed protein product [Rhizoctonia solani]|uniref:Cyanovirin-N domain-containing protein n=1 Tax=Rhizoctonia solani TaxID=456999 RepID=A0A8H3CMB7_9AGAM|nr:unnamed protein product [Rhizoctonia solani]